MIQRKIRKPSTYKYMSAFSASLVFATPDPSVDPPLFADAVAELNDLAVVTITGDATTYIVSLSTAPPGVDDRDKLWVQIAAPDNHLVGIYYWWNGFWRKCNTPRPYSVHMFSGDPTAYFNVDGTGIKGADYDGYVMCDGRNGTNDLSDQFIIAAHMNNTTTIGYDPTVDGTTVPPAAVGWRTTILGGNNVSGGVVNITLDATNTYRKSFAGLSMGTWQADGNAPVAGTGLLGIQHPEIAGEVIPILPPDDGLSTAVISPITGLAVTPIAPIVTVPPFYAMAYVAWVGYEAY
jgi:hypothetical protein